LQAGLARMEREGRTDPLAHADSRPPIVEIEAVNRAIFFAEQTDGWVHIVHLSAAGAADLVAAAKARGVRVTAETCPQYLALDLDDLRRLGPFAKCAPAIRSRDDVEALWGFLADGTLDCVTSDHCGFTSSSKEAGRENIWDAPNGLPGIQTLLPIVISEGLRRGFSWERIAEVTAAAPARLWRIDDRKGAIRIGADADLALVDPNAATRVTADGLFQTQKWSPFEGAEFAGRVVRTILRGTTIFTADPEPAVTVEPGFGRFLAARPV
ncbi:MAG: amidohydrolase family protein, partial [Thermomicrobiales bacterium]|nr:amidohydrolase family protein [Thermomicrobiales bacterium]